MDFQLLGDALMGKIVLADDQDPRGVHIDAVDDSGAHHPVDSREISSAVIHQAVDQRAAVVAGGGMDYHALRLVDENNILVLVENVQIHLFGHDLRFCGFRSRDLHHIPWENPVTAFFRLSVDQNAAVF